MGSVWCTIMTFTAGACLVMLELPDKLADDLTIVFLVFYGLSCLCASIESIGK